MTDKGFPFAPAEAAWAEVARLRGLLSKLEWAGGLVTFPGGCEPCCPVCDAEEADPQGHDLGCWLAKELGR